jgi:hypothetical protein
MESTEGKCSLVGREPADGLGEIWQEEKHEECGQARWSPFDDEEPPPSRNIMDLVHVTYSICDGSAESSRESCTGKDKGDTYCSIQSQLSKDQGNSFI